MGGKTPVPGIKEATAATLFAKTAPSGNFSGEIQPEPIRKISQPLTPAKKQELSEKLLTAAWQGDIQKAWDLLDAGADVDTRNFAEETPLICAAHGGHCDVGELLIAKRADINAQTRDGSTALMMACWFGNTAFIILLLENKADVGIAKKDGYVVLPHLIRLAKSNQEIERLLRNGVRCQGISGQLAEKVSAPPVPRTPEEQENSVEAYIEDRLYQLGKLAGTKLQNLAKKSRPVFSKAWKKTKQGFAGLCSFTASLARYCLKKIEENQPPEVRKLLSSVKSALELIHRAAGLQVERMIKLLDEAFKEMDKQLNSMLAKPKKKETAETGSKKDSD